MELSHRHHAGTAADALAADTTTSTDPAATISTTTIIEEIPAALVGGGTNKMIQPMRLDSMVHHLSFDGDAPSSTSSSASTTQLEDFQTLRFFPLLAILFYTVSGGPYGCEACIRAGGNFYALMGFLIAPLIWSLPEALMTAELGTALPEASAGVAWVEEAFGNQAGWIFGYLTWISGATDNAIYPVLFMDYLLQALHNDDNNEETGSLSSPMVRVGLITATSLLLAYINWLGLPLVGKLSVSICIMSMSPFIVLCLVGIWKVEPSRWLTMPLTTSTDGVVDDDDETIGPGFISNPALGGVLWRPFLNNLFWNLNSFDSGASFVEDIHDPSHLLPKALNWSVVVVAAGYFLPLLVATGASDSVQHDWVDGYLARVVSEVVGPWLGAWTVFAAGVSNIALFQAELAADSLQLMSMSERGYLPKAFGKRSKHGTPTVGILLCTAVIVVMGACNNLDSLIEMLNFNYGLSVLMEYSAFIKLRISQPELQRPYRIPLNTLGCILFFLPPIVFTMIVLGLASYVTLGVSFCVNLVFMSLFYAKQYSSRHRFGCCNTAAYEKVSSVSTNDSSIGNDDPLNLPSADL